MAHVLPFVPVPIKSLQSVPFVTSFIFGELKVSKYGDRKDVKKNITNKNSDVDTVRNTIDDIDKRLAKSIPGYTCSNQSDTNINDDAKEERIIMQEDTVSTLEDTKKHQSLCKVGDVIG